MAFKKVNKAEQGLGGNKIGGKFLFYGFAGSSKTYTALTFPKSAILDSDTGSSFYLGQDIKIGGKTYNNVELVDTTANLDDLEEGLQAIIDGELEGIETLIIDSETKFYNSMDIACTEVEERKAKLAGKNVDTRSKWGRVKNINTKMSAAKISASAQGYHVVSIAQAKEIVDEDTKQKYIGFEAHKSLPFDMDVVVYFFTKVNKQTKEVEYYGEIKKDRTGVTKVGQIILNVTYDIWKPYFDKRNGLELNGANLSKDIKDSTTSTLSDADKGEELAKEIKELIKQADDKAAIKDKFKELGVDVKTMDTADISKLEEIKKFIKSL